MCIRDSTNRNMNAWMQTIGIDGLKPLLATLVLPPMPWLLLILLGGWWLRRSRPLGRTLLLTGVALGAWIDDFARVGVGVIAVTAGLAVLAWVLDTVAALMGARRAGASPQALVGAAIGTVVGLFMGLVGVLFMPFVGAVAGELLAHRDQQRALKVGVGTSLGIVLGTVMNGVTITLNAFTRSVVRERLAADGTARPGPARPARRALQPGGRLPRGAGAL